MMNLVGSHDTTRLLSYLDGIDDDRKQKDIASVFPTYETTSDTAKRRQYLVALIQMTYAGAPTIYYGDEIGMVGSDDPDDRRAMEWGKGNKELVEWYAKLGGIRRSYSALTTGSIAPIDSGNDAVMAYLRSDNESQIIVATNNSSEPITVELGANGKAEYTEILSNKKLTCKDEKFNVTIPAYSGVICTDHVKPVMVSYDGLKPAYDSRYIVGSGTPAPDEPSSSNPSSSIPTPDKPSSDTPSSSEPTSGESSSNDSSYPSSSSDESPVNSSKPSASEESSKANSSSKISSTDNTKTGDYSLALLYIICFICIASILFVLAIRAQPRNHVK